MYRNFIRPYFNGQCPFPAVSASGRLMRILLLLPLLCVFSCAKDPEESAAVQAVKAYNVALVQTYRDAVLDYMKPFASEDEINKLYPLMLALGAINSRMVAIQDEFKVLDVDIEQNIARVETKEKWTYWWEDRQTGAIVKPKAVQDYKIVYRLKKVRGRWIVNSLQPE